MSICKVEKIEALRGERYMITTADGDVLLTPQPVAGSLGAVGVRGAIAAMTGPFWATIELDAAGFVATLEGVEF